MKSLFEAIASGNIESISAEIKATSNINSLHDGETVLTHALKFNDPDVIGLLISRAADPHLENSQKKTAFDVSIDNGNLDAWSILKGFKQESSVLGVANEQPVVLSANQVLKKLYANWDFFHEVNNKAYTGITYQEYESIAQKYIKNLSSDEYKILKESFSSVNFIDDLIRSTTELYEFNNILPLARVFGSTVELKDIKKSKPLATAALWLHEHGQHSDSVFSSLQKLHSKAEWNPLETRLFGTDKLNIDSSIKKFAELNMSDGFIFDALYKLKTSNQRNAEVVIDTAIEIGRHETFNLFHFKDSQAPKGKKTQDFVSSLFFIGNYAQQSRVEKFNFYKETNWYDYAAKNNCALTLFGAQKKGFLFNHNIEPLYQAMTMDTDPAIVNLDKVHIQMDPVMLLQLKRMFADNNSYSDSIILAKWLVNEGLDVNRIDYGKLINQYINDQSMLDGDKIIKLSSLSTLYINSDKTNEFDKSIIADFYIKYSKVDTYTSGPNHNALLRSVVNFDALNSLSNSDETILMFTCKTFNHELMRSLIMAGADHLAENKRGENAFSFIGKSKPSSRSLKNKNDMAEFFYMDVKEFNRKKNQLQHGHQQPQCKAGM